MSVKVYQERFSLLALLRRIVASPNETSLIEEAKELLETIDNPIQKTSKPKVGRQHSGKFEIAPRIEGGVDHTADGIVLMKKGNLRLVWRKGGTYASGQSRNYAAPDLEILVPGKGMPMGITNHYKNKTRRLSKALIMDHKEVIEEYFGIGTAVLAANLKETVIIE